jgi:hypothetical protein
MDDAQHRSEQTDEGGVGSQGAQKTEAPFQKLSQPDALGFHGFLRGVPAPGYLVQPRQQHLGFKTGRGFTAGRGRRPGACRQQRLYLRDKLPFPEAPAIKNSGPLQHHRHRGNAQNNQEAQHPGAASQGQVQHHFGQIHAASQK